MTWALVHAGCGEVAFRFVQRPGRGQLVNPVSARLIDGSTPISGSPMVCGTCGRDVANFNLRDEFLREEAEAV